MLRLSAPTSEAWVESALSDLPTLLVDHAHCEKKAAGAAVRLLFGYPDRPFLMDPLSKLAREELQHFEVVLGVLSERGIGFRSLRPAAYASLLRQAVRGDDPDRLFDTLLCAALIEARSCERFGILAERVPDPTLSKLYESLLACEARHHGTYLDLAAEVRSADSVTLRLDELSQREATILSQIPADARMHAGGVESLTGSVAVGKVSRLEKE